MAEVKWIKIVTDIFDDEKILLIESLPDSDAIITCWFKLLCLAGKQNNSGVFMLADKIAYTDEMFATIFRRPLNTVRMALKTFENFGMIEIVNGVVTIPNWDKHQSLDSYEKKKQRDRLYQAERRANQRALIKSSDKSSDIVVSDIDIEEDKDIDKNNKYKDPFLAVKKSDSDLYQALRDFEAMRKKIKKPMTDRSKSLLLKKLGEYPDANWIPMLEQSIEHCWQTVYPVKEGGYRNGCESTSFTEHGEEGSSRFQIHYDA